MAQIQRGAPRRLDVLEFTPDIKLTPERYAGIEATCYTRDIWEGRTKTQLSDAAIAYGSIVDTAPNAYGLVGVAARRVSRGISAYLRVFHLDSED